MANVALKLNNPEASYVVATVVATEADHLLVRVGRSDRRAQRAASCLVAPEVGDEVALVITGEGRVFVIAVLVTAAERGVDIDVEGDLRIRAEGTLSLASRVMNLRAAEGSVVLAKLSVLASTVISNSESVRVAAKTFDGFVERLSQTAKRCYRKVEELDQLRAARADYRTEHELSMRSENFLVGAKKLAKVDAEQIHIG